MPPSRDGPAPTLPADGNPGSVVVVDTATFKTLKTYTWVKDRRPSRCLTPDEFLVVNNDTPVRYQSRPGEDTVVTSAVGAHPSAFHLCTNCGARDSEPVGMNDFSGSQLPLTCGPA